MDAADTAQVQMAEIRGLLIKLANEVGQIKGQLQTLPDVSQKLDMIGDIAKAAKNSTDSAHKRLDDINKIMERMEVNSSSAAKDAGEALRIANDNQQQQRELEKDLERVDKTAEAARITAESSEKRLDKLDNKFWAILLAMIGVIIKMFFDHFNPGGTP